MAPAPTMTSMLPRIVHIDDGHGWRGGQHQVFLLLRELASLGLKQLLVTQPGSPLQRRAATLPIQIAEKRMRGEWDLFASAAIAREARAFGATLLHAHTGHAHTLGLRAARRSGLPLVVTRRVDFAIRAGFFSRRKYTAEGQHFIAISQAVRTVLQQGGVAPGAISLVHSGVPPIDSAAAWSRERVRSELGIAPDEIALLNLGALTDHKGQRYLIDAAPGVLGALPAARIHVVGEGELREALATRIAELGLQDRVRLHGHLPDARLKLAGFDLFVSSSHLEGLGTVILDAMLAGLPVVAAAAGGVVDAVREGETGWLAPNRDAQGLAAAIIRAWRDVQSGAGATRIERARAQVQHEFSAPAMARGTWRVYQQILGS